MSGIIGHAGSRSGIIGDHNLKQYDLTITGMAGPVAKGIPYKTSNGHWWLKGIIKGSFSGESNDNIHSIIIGGITWTENFYAITLAWQGAQSSSMASHGYTYQSGSNAQINMIWNGVQDHNGVWGYSFDAPLTSKPTWAD